MKEINSSSVRKVKVAIARKGYSFEIKVLPDSTRTAKEAAEAIGCTIPEIAKSLIFKGAESDNPILVIASGSNRVDTEKISKLVNEKVVKADADFIRSETGFAIGGIPPVGHKYSLNTIIDEDLMNFDVIWAAAGTPFAVFSLHSKELENITGGNIATVKE